MMSRRTTVIAVVAVVAATVARLIGLIDHLVSVARSPVAVGEAIVSFYLPVLTASGILFVILLVFSEVIGDQSEDSRGTSPVPDFDQIDSTYQDEEALKRVTERSQQVVQNQLSILDDTDDKAVRTVRVEVVLLAAIASAGQLARGSLPVNIWLKLGGVLVLFSIVAGVFTYSSSRPDFGPGPRYVHESIAEGAGRRRVYLELIAGYREAIDHNRGVINDSSLYLTVTQVLLILGLIFGGVGLVAVLNVP